MFDRHSIQLKLAGSTFLLLAFTVCSLIVLTNAQMETAFSASMPSAASCVCQFSFWRKSTSTRLSCASSSTIKTLRCMCSILSAIGYLEAV